MSDKKLGSYSSGMLHLRVRELVLLEMIHETGSLRGAAAALHVTQPAITQALRSLEQAFGVALVQRGSRGERRTQLTPAGLNALQRLRVVGEELRLARQGSNGSAQAQVLRLGALPFAAMDWLPGALAQFAQDNPTVRVDLVEGTVGELWSHLVDGRIDIVANYLLAPQHMRALVADFAHCVIGSTQVVPVAPANHPVFRRKSIDLSYLAAQRWVFPPAGAQAHTELVSGFLKGGVRAPDAEMVAERHLTRLAMAQAMGLLTVVPVSALRWQGHAPRMRQLPGQWLTWSVNLVLAVRKSSLQLPAANAFFRLFS